MILRSLFIAMLFAVNVQAMDITYVPTAPQEAESLTQLAMDANATYGYRSVSDEEARKLFFLKLDDFEKGIVRLMKLDGATIGFFNLKRKLNAEGKEVDELVNLFLKPGYMRQGYGRLMFQQAAKVANDELRWSSFIFESDPFSTGFYEKMGAVKIGENRCPLHPDYRSPVFYYEFDKHE